MSIDVTYETPNQHNNPIEMHATVARWDGDGDAAVLRMWDANQGPHNLVPVITEAFGITEDQLHITSPYVGGAFGSKAYTHVHQLIAGMAAKVTGRTVKIELTRPQMFTLVGHRTPTIQRLRLGAQPDGTLTAISHEVVEHTSQNAEFAEQTATATRLMYAAPARRTTHRLARLDVPAPTIMRAPGETPACTPWSRRWTSSRRAGHGPGRAAAAQRARPRPRAGRAVEHPQPGGLPPPGRRAVRLGRPGPAARDAHRRPVAGRHRRGRGDLPDPAPALGGPDPGRARRPYVVSIDASDIGTGAWTALTQIAADALRVPMSEIDLRIGDSRLPKASGAGGSTGITSWGPAIIAAAEQLAGREVPPGGLTVTGDAGPGEEAEKYSSHAFGAHFAEVRVDQDSGEVRVPRMTGVFAAGRIINATTGRSQFLGGMTMGLSMALHEESVLDLARGHYANHDLAEYHIAANADVGEMDISWVEESDDLHNPLGAKGIGEIGIVGAAAAIGNAYWHATGRRVRDLPITPDKWFR